LSRRQQLVRPNVLAAGAVGSALGGGLGVATAATETGDPTLLGILGLGLSLTIAILLFPVYTRLGGDRRLLSFIESLLAQVAITLASWAAVYGTIRFPFA